MKVKELKELLNDFEDEADIRIDTFYDNMPAERVYVSEDKKIVWIEAE